MSALRTIYRAMKIQPVKQLVFPKHAHLQADRTMCLCVVAAGEYRHVFMGLYGQNIYEQGVRLCGTPRLHTYQTYWSGSLSGPANSRSSIRYG